MSSRPLIWILVVGLVARLALWGYFRAEPLRIGDEKEYNDVAVSLAKTGEFAAATGELTSIRPPLHPVVISMIYRVAGIENYQAVRLFQTLVSLVTVAVVHVVARRMYDVGAANWAAAFVCFYPSLLIYSNFLLTEVLFAFWVCLACLVLQQYWATNKLPWLALFGVLLGLGALTRSVLWLFPPFLIGYLVFAQQSGRPWFSRVAVCLVPVLTFGLTIAPWSYRNTRLQKTFTTVDVMGGRNFMMGNYEHTPLYRMWDAIGITDERAWYRVLAEETPGYDQLTQGQRDKLAMKRGVRFVWGHPQLTAQRTLVRFFNFWQLDRSVVAGLLQGWWGDLSKPAILVIAAVIFGGYASGLLAGIFGFLTVPPKDQRLHWFMFLLVAFVCAVHTAVFGHSRYHKSLMPLLLIYAGAAIQYRHILLASWRTTGFRVAAIVSAMLVASWVFEVVVVEWPRRGLERSAVSAARGGKPQRSQRSQRTHREVRELTEKSEKSQRSQRNHREGRDLRSVFFR